VTEELSAAFVLPEDVEKQELPLGASSNPSHWCRQPFLHIILVCCTKDEFKKGIKERVNRAVEQERSAGAEWLVVVVLQSNPTPLAGGLLGALGSPTKPAGKESNSTLLTSPFTASGPNYVFDKCCTHYRRERCCLLNWSQDQSAATLGTPGQWDELAARVHLLLRATIQDRSIRFEAELAVRTHAHLTPPYCSP
jgi:hypothetical protein